MKNLVITGEDLTIQDVVEVARGNRTVVLGEIAKSKIIKANDLIAELVKSGKPFYGINTGFGCLESKKIDSSEMTLLAENIIITHSVAVGEDMPLDWVRAGILIRINSLAKGNSGAQLITVQTMVDMLNKGIVPAVPRKGSLASSGDLCLLSHIALAFCDTHLDVPSMVYIQKDGSIENSKCEKIPAKKAFEIHKIPRVKLGPKEGLALTNGSSVTTGIGCLVVHDATRLFYLGLTSLALTSEALCAKKSPFDERIHIARNHKGQKYVAECIRKLTDGSKMDSINPAVQDSYSLRCSPQVQGVLFEAIEYTKKILTNEINGTTDNPLIFEPGVVLSGGNFHGEIIGHAIDTLKMAVTELAGISERRTFKMLSSNTSNNLPTMLTPEAGLNSGYMIVQYSSAALALENLKLAHSDAIYSLPTSGGAEDYNANGANSALSATQIIVNTAQILANEILCAVRGIELRIKAGVSLLGTMSGEIYRELRALLGENEKDHYLKLELDNMLKYIWHEKDFAESITKKLEPKTMKKMSVYVYSNDEKNYEKSAEICSKLWSHKIMAKYLNGERQDAVLKAKLKNVHVIINVNDKSIKAEILEDIPNEILEKIYSIVNVKN